MSQWLSVRELHLLLLYNRIRLQDYKHGMAQINIAQQIQHDTHIQFNMAEV